MRDRVGEAVDVVEVDQVEVQGAPQGPSRPDAVAVGPDPGDRPPRPGDVTGHIGQVAHDNEVVLNANIRGGGTIDHLNDDLFVLSNGCTRPRQLLAPGKRPVPVEAHANRLHRDGRTLSVGVVQHDGAWA